MAFKMSKQTRSRSTLPAVVFDGDDTLWVTEPLYDAVREEAAAIVAKAGVDPVIWEKFEREIDVANVASLGFSSVRFPTSCVTAYVEAARHEGVSIDPSTSRRIVEVAGSVFTKVAPLDPSALAVLNSLRGEYRVVLYTQGDAEVQKKRISDSGLSPLFDFILVIAHKTPRDFSQLVQSMGLDPRHVVSVGNSLRSDVIPAVEAGVNAIWLERHVWEYEREVVEIESPLISRTPELGDVPRLVHDLIPRSNLVVL